MNKAALNKLKNIAGTAAYAFTPDGIWATDRYIILHSPVSYDGPPEAFGSNDYITRSPNILNNVIGAPHIHLPITDVTALLKAFRLRKAENYHVPHPTLIHICPQGTLILQNYHDETPATEGGDFMSAFSPTPTSSIPITLNAYYLAKFPPDIPFIKVDTTSTTILYDTFLDDRLFIAVLATMKPDGPLADILTRELEASTCA